MRNLKKSIICLCSLCSFLIVVPKAGHTQDTLAKVEGIVSDIQQYPLKSTTVTVRSNNKIVMHTFTDSAGKFAIEKLARGTYDFSFSHIGYNPQIIKEYKVKPGSINTLSVQLKGDANSLNDVIVIGYGMVSKRDLTGSVSSIKADAFSDRAILSLADAIKGRAAGVQITQDDGAPGAGSTIRIRGATSVSASSAPLYVIDGVMQDDADNIDPADIESVQILKDASSTAIYGSRGANGVIIITTKTGKAGKTFVELYSNAGFQQPSHLYKLMNSEQYEHSKYLNQFVYSQASATDPNQPATTQTGYTYYRDSPLGTDGGFWGVPTDGQYNNWASYGDPDSINTDWQKAVFQRGIVQDYHLSVSGGNANTKYSFQGGYFNQDGLIVFSGYKRYSGRFNLTQKLSGSVNFFANLSATQTGTNGFISTNQNVGIVSNPVVSAVLYQPPVNPLTYTDVEDNSDIDGYVTTNPYSLAKYVTNQRKVNQQISRIGINWTINKNFSFQTTANYTNTHIDFDAYYPKNVASGAKFNGRALLSRGGVSDVMNENLLYYKGKLGTAHRFNAMLGATFEANNNNTVGAENRNFDVEGLGAGGIVNGTQPQNPTYDKVKWTMASFLGRLDYSYKSRYLATITFRADGSSRFSKTDKWGYFPSIALAWNASREDFLKNVRAINNLKFRATMGQSGNTAIPSYLTLSTISTAFAPINGSDPVFGVIVDRPENLSLKWETTTQYDGGMDLSIFKDRISFTADWYLKRTKNLLIQKATPGYTGYATTWTNFGSIQNQGLEFNINAIVIDKSFNWNVAANIGFNRAKAIDVGGELDLDPGVIPSIGTTVVLKNGEPLGQWYGYKVDGVFHSEAEIISSGLTSVQGKGIASVSPGTPKFIDQNGDGVIDAKDRTTLGRGQPDFTGGFINNFSYKGFALNVGIQYSYGNKIYNANRLPSEGGLNSDNLRAENDKAWSPDLYDMNTGELEQKGNTTSNTSMPARLSSNFLTSDFIEDGSFIRISDVTLSYSIKSSVADHIGLQNLSFFVSGKNLFLWTKYQGYDPEVNTRQGGFGDLMPSLDYASYPRSKIYSIGLKATF